MRRTGPKAENKKPYQPENEHDLDKMEVKKVNSTLDASYLKAAGVSHKKIAGFLNMKYGHECIPWALYKAGFSERNVISAINQKKLGLTNTEKMRSLYKLRIDWYLPLERIDKEVRKLECQSPP